MNSKGTANSNPRIRIRRVKGRAGWLRRGKGCDSGPDTRPGAQGQVVKEQMQRQRIKNGIWRKSRVYGSGWREGRAGKACLQRALGEVHAMWTRVLNSHSSRARDDRKTEKLQELDPGSYHHHFFLIR